MPRQSFDPVSLEILWSRLVAMVDEAAVSYARASFSTLVREANDYAVVLTDAAGHSVAQSSASIPSFIGTLPATVRRTLEEFADQGLADRDVVITNDPWDGTGHIHDATIVVPIFVHGTLTAFAAIASHLPDIGGRIRTLANREIFEEGLQLPLVKLVRAGRPDKTLIAVIERNVRVPERTMGDIWGAIAACRGLGERLRGFLEETGVALADLAHEVQARSEAAMRAAIAALPDGRYRHVLQHDGFEERITLDGTVIVRGDEIVVDYDGTSTQLPRAVNVVPIYTFAYTAYAIKALLCPEVPNNEGSFRPVATRAPEGSILNPHFPAATGARALVGHMLPALVMAALAPLLPDKVWAEGSANSSFNMSGQHHSQRFTMVSFLNAGQGASARRRGHDALSFPSNLGNTPIEVMEALAPIRIEHRRIRRSSGGKGRNRGGDGLALKFTYLGDMPAVCSFLTSRRLVPPNGLLGGGPGRTAAVRLNGRVVDPSDHWELRQGDCVEILTAGGGGWGAVP